MVVHQVSLLIPFHRRQPTPESVGRFLRRPLYLIVRIVRLRLNNRAIIRAPKARRLIGPRTKAFIEDRSWDIVGITCLIVNGGPSRGRPRAIKRPPPRLDPLKTLIIKFPLPPGGPPLRIKGVLIIEPFLHPSLSSSNID